MGCKVLLDIEYRQNEQRVAKALYNYMYYKQYFIQLRVLRTMLYTTTCTTNNALYNYLYYKQFGGSLFETESTFVVHFEYCELYKYKFGVLAPVIFLQSIQISLYVYPFLSPHR